MFQNPSTTETSSRSPSFQVSESLRHSLLAPRHRFRVDFPFNPLWREKFREKEQMFSATLLPLKSWFLSFLRTLMSELSSCPSHLRTAPRAQRQRWEPSQQALTYDQPAEYVRTGIAQDKCWPKMWSGRYQSMI